MLLNVMIIHILVLMTQMGEGKQELGELNFDIFLNYSLKFREYHQIFYSCGTIELSEPWMENISLVL